jgi:carbon-monoxide dehydrogenase iron sulfur subunit
VKRIVADPRKCVACRACEMACALAHADTDDIVEAIVEKGARPSIYIESAGAFVVPLQCRHCEDAPCMAVCPSAALVRPDEDGPVLVDQEKCIGCAFCVQACPFGLVRVARRPGANGSDGKKKMVVVKCDHCAGRQAEGLGPACVESCPVGALAFVEVDAVAKKARARAAADVAGEVITGARN